jgi:single-stranded-DNA-specific exonuclease
MVHIAGHLSLNHWNGSVSTQIRIVDAAKVDLSRQ